MNWFINIIVAFSLKPHGGYNIMIANVVDVPLEAFMFQQESFTCLFEQLQGVMHDFFLEK